MQLAAVLAQRGAGDRAGKLLGDPFVWYAVTASLDGIAPFSEEPVERLRFMVHQRRQLVEAMKTKALLMATLNPDKAEKSAQDYFNLALPVGEDNLDARLKAREREVAELDNMAPIRLGQIKAGEAMLGTQQWGSSMHRR